MSYPKFSISNVIAWIALAVAIAGFGAANIHNRVTEDIGVHERLAKLEAQIGRIEKAVDDIHKRMFDEGRP